MKLSKPILLVLIGSALLLDVGARQLNNKLGLQSKQRQNILSILKSGDRANPATRKRMQRQIMEVLTPAQENQLNYELQQQASRNNTTAYYNRRYQNDGYNLSGSNNNSGYYSDNRYSNKRNMLQGLLNNGILNGVLGNLVEL